MDKEHLKGWINVYRQYFVKPPDHYISGLYASKEEADRYADLAQRISCIYIDIPIEEEYERERIETKTKTN